MSQVEVDKIIPQSGTTLTIGDSGDTITIPSGVTLSNSGIITNFESTGIDDNATSTAITIDSSERVGIGETAPLGLLHVKTADTGASSVSTNANELVIESTGNVGITLQSENTGTGNLYFGDVANGSVGRVSYDHGSNFMSFNTNASERMRINSSGDVLVSKTGTVRGTAGIELRNDGFIRGERAGTVAEFNRLSSDGIFLDFRKDGTEVGSIGVLSNRIYIGDSDTGLFIDDSNNAVSPYSVTASNTVDNTIDLGISSKRYKDLYLGGGLYVGGTGTANKLDDYEEGTWTPTASSGLSSFNVVVANYRKVGSLVFVQAFLNTFSGKSASNLIIGGLPFSTETDGFAIGNIEGGSTGGKMGTARPSSASTSINFYYPDTSTLERTIYTGNDVGDFIILSLTYHTA